MNLQYENLLLELVNNDFNLDKYEDYCLVDFKCYTFEISPFKLNEYDCINIKVVKTKTKEYVVEIETPCAYSAYNYLTEFSCYW